MRLFVPLTAALLLTTTFAFGRPKPGLKPASIIPSLAHTPPENGIDPTVADHFWEKWHFVTSRYRRDNNQTRVIFANDLAWTAMVKRSSKYPDGAMLAKAIFDTQPDPVFPASLVPKIYKEIEFMKKDSKKYTKTGGWGYAFYFYDFNKNRNHVPPTPDVERKMAPTCYACHTIVKKRDYVFSMPAFLQWYLNDPRADDSLFENQFGEVKVADLPTLGQKILRHYYGTKFKKVKYYDLPFFLTGEQMAIVSVAQFTAKENLPHLILSEFPNSFILTVPAPERHKCVRYNMSVPAHPGFIESGYICHSKIERVDMVRSWYKVEGAKFMGRFGRNHSRRE